MNCLHPVIVRNPRYDISKIDSEPTHISVPCGRCPACVQSRSTDWRIRLSEENRFAFSALFLTLTYSDDCIPFERVFDSFHQSHISPVLCKRDVQLFFKRLRIHYERECGWHLPIRYFLCGEYGPRTLRPHYHAVVFNLPFTVNSKEHDIVKTFETVGSCWSNGFVKVDPVTPGRIAYVTKYVTMAAGSLPEWLPKPFFLMSRRPGLGFCYLAREERVDWHRRNFNNYYPNGSHKGRLPRYLKDKIFDDNMKEILHDHLDFDLLLEKQKDRAFLCGFDSGDVLKDLVDHHEFQADNFIRKFNQKYIKSRQDL